MTKTIPSQVIQRVASAASSFSFTQSISGSLRYLGNYTQKVPASKSADMNIVCVWRVKKIAAGF